MECKPIMQPSDINPNCQVTSTWNYTSCTGSQAKVFNESGTNVRNFTYSNYGTTGLCYFLWNITTIGSYNFIVGNGDTGNILIEGDKKMMNFTVIIFLMVFNIGVFLLPLIIREYTHRKSTDYIIRHLMWMGGIVFLWFNMTILRQMASDAGLGIDAQLAGYWWFFSLLMVCVLAGMVYVTTVGAVKLSQEANMQERMGYSEHE